MKPTLESRDQWDADIVSIALRTGGTIPADLFVREMKRAIATEREACMEVCWDIGGIEAIACANLIRARGKEPKRHPGYIVGDHWLQTAYSRICAGDDEAEVMADYGYKRGQA